MKRVLEAPETNGHLSGPERLIDRYDRGYSTASELMLSILTLTDTDEVKKAIGIVPKPVLNKLKQFVGYYTDDTQVFNGPPPNKNTVRFVRELLARPKKQQAQ